MSSVCVIQSRMLCLRDWSYAAGYTVSLRNSAFLDERRDPFAYCVDVNLLGLGDLRDGRRIPMRANVAADEGQCFSLRRR